ncbi:hypothetical protein [Mucilaginibacter myungsuensis]|uniref:Uncharacterized protein n=1 Tax=Mucilaginibacter myungsuensis TaxID=649104 RepID=A0A929KZT4_9SPHI|nr:hypothetical protein [Mucilaginibacter myungsuensis]MBE9663632.1 hypothetical protein [Mucilaginibacter myungsuensis]MDN3599044.1 hypothetical protein [Mucilaginibacter myungsuensis]
MDYNIITLEIATLLIHFDHYDQLLAGPTEEQIKIRNKKKEHLAEFLKEADLPEGIYLTQPITEWTNSITQSLPKVKNKDIHELVEKLEKDVKKIKKLYKETVKKEVA